MLDVNEYLSNDLRIPEFHGSYGDRAWSVSSDEDDLLDIDEQQAWLDYQQHDPLDNEDEDAFFLNLSKDAVRQKIIKLAMEIEQEQAMQFQRFQQDQLKEMVKAEAETISTESQVQPSPMPLMSKDNRKRRLCRHFLKGHCKRGASCDFLHDSSIFCPDKQKVFLGGLPSTVNAELLCQKLADLGYDVINKPKVLRGFTPQVCLATMEQAQRLIELGKIFIDGSMVDVRPYEDKKPPDDLKRSVFLGGLPNDVTVNDIKESLQMAGVRVCNFPIIKAGFTPQVVLGTPEEAQRLIKAKKVNVAGKFVEVRPYVNFRKRY